MGDSLDRIAEIMSGIDNIRNTFADSYNFQSFQIPTDEIQPIDISKFAVEDSVPYQIRQQTNEILEKSQEHVDLLKEQNKNLCETITTLKEILDLKQKELDESKEETKKARRNSRWMSILTIITTLIALAAWIFPSPFA